MLTPDQPENAPAPSTPASKPCLYTLALVTLALSPALALLFLWASVFQQSKESALLYLFIFAAPLTLAYVYLYRFCFHPHAKKEPRR